MFRKEVSVLVDLLQAQMNISEWQFLPSILAIQSADSKLTLWNGIVPLGSQVNPAWKQLYSIITFPDIHRAHNYSQTNMGHFTNPLH